MAKSEIDINRGNYQNLIGNFNLGITEKPDLEIKSQAPDRENHDICLPPLLVEAFQGGLEEGSQACDCGCGEDHDCTASSSGQHCGGCNHHG